MMTSSADLLQLLHGASSSFTTLAAAVRTWEHPARFQQACRQAGVFGTSAGTSCLAGADPDEIEWTGRVWLAGPDRFRVEERDRRGGQRIMAVDRDRWFMQTSRGQLVADHGSPPAGTYGFADVLDAALYPRWLDYEPVGSARHSDRECIRVLAFDREVPDWRTRPAELVGDERELLVDAERGVVLRVESRTAGQPFYVAELSDVVFDEPMADTLLSLQAHPGSPVLSYADYEAYPWPSLADAVQRATFTVLVPNRPPAGAGLEVYWSGAPGEPGELQLSYRRGPELLLQLRETSATPPPTSLWDGDEVVRNDQRIRVAESGASTVARTVIDGTHVVLLGPIDRAAIVDLAASLRHAGTTPTR